MESHDNSIMRTLLILMTVFFLAVTLLGCHDPYAVDIEAEHRRLSSIAKQELRQGRLSAFPLSSQAEVFYPAQ